MNENEKIEAQIKRVADNLDSVVILLEIALIMLGGFGLYSIAHPK